MIPERYVHQGILACPEINPPYCFWSFHIFRGQLVKDTGEVLFEETRMSRRPGKFLSAPSSEGSVRWTKKKASTEVEEDCVAGEGETNMEYAEMGVVESNNFYVTNEIGDAPTRTLTLPMMSRRMNVRACSSTFFSRYRSNAKVKEVKTATMKIRDQHADEQPFICGTSISRTSGKDTPSPPYAGAGARITRKAKTGKVRSGIGKEGV